MKLGCIFLRHSPVKISWLLTVIPILALPYTCVLAADAVSQQELVAGFWASTSETERLAMEAQLIEGARDTAELYHWFKTGPHFSIDVPKGQQESLRVAGDGTRFPYVYLIPESYNPEHSYPVEFMLHGGVSRPEWEPGGGWWRRGYESLKQEDRIVVVPASWEQAFWWHENQAENLPAILKELKRTYNIDENRVTLSGVSDGGTGAYFFAFKQPTEWAAFFPYIGHPGVLRNSQGGGGYRLYFENLMTKPLYIVNGELDRLYPASSLQGFIKILGETGVEYVFKAIKGGGHDTRWLPGETTFIEEFKLEHPRDPLPERIRWVADRIDKFNRNSWIQIDGLSRTPGLLDVRREDNLFVVSARGVSQFTLLLNPEEVDFSQPILVNVNGTNVMAENVGENKEILLKWAQKDLDRKMLFTAELNVQVPD
jgi:predicted esterase